MSLFRAVLEARQDSPEMSTGDRLLELLQDPFNTNLQQKAIIASLITSLGLTGAIALLFCFLRPYNTVVYAPRLKHSDSKHAPPTLGKSPWAWVSPVLRTKEDELAEKIGLDATIFLRFTKMCRNMFLVLSVVGCAIIVPVNLVGGKKTDAGGWDQVSSVMKLTPQYMIGAPFWGFVAAAYVFSAVVCFYLWWNYRAVARLRVNYFQSSDYQNSLHSRTLLITDVPHALRTDEGLARIADSVKTTPSMPRTVIARNVKDIPEKIEEHDKAVRQLEEVLAKYLKNPDRLPLNRPMCKPSKKDKQHTQEKKVDAIEYLTARIERLEAEIKEERKTLDKRNPQSYGFATYKTIEEAHNLAYTASGNKKEGTVIRLAPKPSDLLWQNLGMSPSSRWWQKISNNLWVALLTVAWIVPNVFIAVFLTNLNNLAAFWPAFKGELERNSNVWSAVQGILAPALTSLFYFFLPKVFRRLCIKAGDVSKASRERHVVSKLFTFFVINNFVVFTFFASVWKVIAAIITETTGSGKAFIDAWEDAEVLNSIMTAFCNISPFWITWLLQRNLGAAIDLSQIANLAWGSFMRKFKSPTPRELIEWTAPPPFDYASYYNYFLFYSTITLCFAAFQPIVLLVTAFYYSLDYVLKKYLLMYVFITKNESGGMYWRVLFNRFIFALLLMVALIALMVGAKGEWFRWYMLGTLAPLPFMIIGFKFWCAHQFDRTLYYYNKGIDVVGESSGLPDKMSRDKDRVAVRFGHPALYKKLLKPMVHQKAQHMLTQIYNGRLHSDVGHDDNASYGYSDSYAMNRMSRGKPGKPNNDTSSPFEIVNEADLDFENFKNRADFRDEFGGEGALYGRAGDLVRPGTPSTMMSGSNTHSRSGSVSSTGSDTMYKGPGAASDANLPGVTYPAGYHSTPQMRNGSPSPYDHVRNGSGGGTGLRNEYTEEYGMLRGAARMPVSTPGGQGPQSRGVTPGSEDEGGYDYFRGRKR